MSGKRRRARNSVYRSVVFSGYWRIFKYYFHYIILIEKKFRQTDARNQI
jgi:hypothetical protein